MKYLTTACVLAIGMFAGSVNAQNIYMHDKA
jgi:hypothetical protein